MRPHSLVGLAAPVHGQMLLATHEGATWRERDYRGWLKEAGFGEIAFEPTQGPATLVYASR
jgi:hypothetical protein